MFCVYNLPEIVLLEHRSAEAYENALSGSLNHLPCLRSHIQITGYLEMPHAKTHGRSAVQVVRNRHHWASSILRFTETYFNYEFRISAHCVLEHSAQATVWIFTTGRIRVKNHFNASSVRKNSAMLQLCMCTKDCTQMRIRMCVISVVDEQSKPAICAHTTNIFTKTMT